MPRKIWRWKKSTLTIIDAISSSSLFKFYYINFSTSWLWIFIFQLIKSSRTIGKNTKHMYIIFLRISQFKISKSVSFVSCSIIWISNLLFESILFLLIYFCKLLECRPIFAVFRNEIWVLENWYTHWDNLNFGPYSQLIFWNLILNKVPISDTFVLFHYSFRFIAAQGIVFRLTTLSENVRFCSVLPTKYLHSRIFMIFICQLENLISGHLHT